MNKTELWRFADLKPWTSCQWIQASSPKRKIADNNFSSSLPQPLSGDRGAANRKRPGRNLYPASGNHLEPTFGSGVPGTLGGSQLDWSSPLQLKYTKPPYYPRTPGRLGYFSTYPQLPPPSYPGPSYYPRTPGMLGSLPTDQQSLTPLAESPDPLLLSFPSWNRQTRNWPTALSDTLLAGAAGYGLSRGLKQWAKDIEGPLLTQQSLPEMLPALDEAQRWLGEKGMDFYAVHPGDGLKLTPGEWLANSSSNSLPADWAKHLRRDLAKIRYGEDTVLTPKQQQALLEDIPDRNRIFLKSQHPDVLFHEAGHLTNHQTLKSILGRFTKNPVKINEAILTINNNRKLLEPVLLPSKRKIRPVSLVGGAGIASAILAPKDSLAGQYAWTAPLVATAPTLVGEASASIRGLNRLSRPKGPYRSHPSLGPVAALKGIPRMTKALGHYAAVPAGLALAAYMINRLKPKQG